MAIAPNLAAPPAGGTARRPVAVVKLDGTELKSVLSVRTTNVAHNAADTFEVELPLQGQPATANWAAWGGDAPPSEIEVLYGFVDAAGNRSALASAVLGPVDAVEVSQPENIIRLSGRDYSSALIDTQTFENFTNQTASQIATKIAQNHGLTPQVQATTTPVGTKDAGTGETTRVTRRESEWDLLTNLARNEGFVCYVRGKTLYFQPDTEPNGTPYGMVWTPPATPGRSPTANLTKLSVKRALTLARSITVTVTSHDATGAKAVSQSASLSAGGAGGSANAKPQIYVVDVPGLTEAQAKARADQLLKSYSLFERVIEAHLPGDPFISFDQPLSLTGTGTGWDDRFYYIDRIERSLSLGGGFTMVLRAKNHSASQGGLKGGSA